MRHIHLKIGNVILLLCTFAFAARTKLHQYLQPGPNFISICSPDQTSSVFAARTKLHQYWCITEYLFSTIIGIRPENNWLRKIFKYRKTIPNKIKNYLTHVFYLILRTWHFGFETLIIFFIILETVNLIYKVIHFRFTMVLFST